MFSDLALSKRLEQVEGEACAEFAAARRRLFPETGAQWIRCGGAYVVFDGADSPVTQTFGLGIFEHATPTVLDDIEQFFLQRGSPVFHEVSPFAGVPALDLLCKRGYRPVEISNVLVRSVELDHSEASAHSSAERENLRVRIAAADEGQAWAEVSARGWAHEHPELREFVLEMGTIAAARKGSICFVAEIDGIQGAAAGLSIHGGVALLAGSASIPEMRRKGLHSALLRERLRYATEHACDLAMIVVQPGSDSQRNAERNGFHIVYTRTKWKLFR